MNRTIAVGDIHGCADELRDLLALCQLRPSDRVVFVGDFLDRGPDPKGVVETVRALGSQALSVMGNHEEKALRWLQREAERKATGRPNKMFAPPPERRAQWESLSEEDVEWLRSQPAMLDLGDWLVVHGGFETKPLEEQHPDKMMRVRYVNNTTGEMVATDHDDPYDPPPGASHWSTRWTGKNVVYGHAVHSLEKPRFDRNGETECWGIDTGCVYGGRLTAFVLETRQVIQVSARDPYARMFTKKSARSS